MTNFFKIQQYTNEQKLRLVYIFIILLFNFQILYIFKFELLYLIIKNLNYSYFIFTNISDFFFTLCIIILFFTIVLTINYSIVQYYLFKKTSLILFQQKNLFYKLIILYTYNIILIIFIIQTLTPNLWNFFLTFEMYNQTLIIELTPNIKNYILFYLNWVYIIYNFHIFLYIFYIFFIKKKYFKIPLILYNRSLGYPILSFICAFLTPPDIFSLLILIIPIYIFLEIILFNFIFIIKLRKIGFEPTM